VVTDFQDLDNDNIRSSAQRMAQTYSADLESSDFLDRADPSMDHSRALWASVAPLPRDWNRRSGRPCHTWLWIIEADLASFNIGLATAYH